MKVKLMCVIEGKAKLLVPDLTFYRRTNGIAEPSYAPIFYNSKMSFSRDVSILVLKTFKKFLNLNLNVCDALAGTGVRGIRYALESSPSRLWLNDANPLAVNLINKNLSLNNLSSISTVSCLDARMMFLKNSYGTLRFNVIDIDPFGSPIKYVETAVRALKDGGLLSLTATDIPALFGKYPITCLRRYGAKPLKSSFAHEIAIRILLGSVVRRVASLDFACKPVLSYFHNHFLRLHLILNKDISKANDSVKKLGWLLYCKNCSYREIRAGIDVSPPRKCPNCSGRLSLAGPLWCGNLFDKVFIRDMLSFMSTVELVNPGDVRSLLEIVYNELDGPPTFYVIDELSRNLSVSSPSPSKVVSSLKSIGFFASRTHFHPKGIRTNASIKIIYDVIRSSI